MLIAKSKMIVGVMKSQAIDRSDSPRTRLASPGGVVVASPSAMCAICDMVANLGRRLPPPHGGDNRPGRSETLLDLAFFLENSCPIFDQLVQRLFGCALIGDYIIMQTLLHGLEERRIGRLLPEVLHASHGLQEVGRERLRLCEAWIVENGIVAAIAAERPPFLLYVGLREPFDIGKRSFHVVGVSDDGHALSPES